MKFLLVIATILTIGAAITANGFASESGSDSSTIRLGVSSSLRDTGLLDYLLPIYGQQFGNKFVAIAVGSGKALGMGRRGEVDGVWVDSPSAEARFVGQGYGIERYPTMQNNLVLLGPKRDPAKVSGSENIYSALSKIKRKGALFVSRGDDSGTHQRELRLWDEAGIDPHGEPWYSELGMSMIGALKAADDQKAYLIADEATFRMAKLTQLEILLRDKDHLHNYYSIMAVNPKHAANINFTGMLGFIQWLVSPEGQKAIASYQESGHQLYKSELLFLYDDDSD